MKSFFGPLFPLDDHTLTVEGAVRGSVSAGYVIDTVRTDRWRLGRRTVEFTPTTAAELGY